MSNAFLDGKPKFRVKPWYTIWLTNSYRDDSKHFSETALQWQTDLHQVFSFPGNESFALPAAEGEAVSVAFGVGLSEHDLIKFEPTYSEITKG